MTDDHDKKPSDASEIEGEGAEIIEILPAPEAFVDEDTPAGTPEPAADAVAQTDEPTRNSADNLPAVDEAPDDTQDVRYNVPKVRDLAEAKCILEALLFTTVEPLPLKKLSALLPPLDPRTIRKIVVEIQSELDAQRRGLQIVEVGKGFQMASRPEYGRWILGLLPHRRKSSLSMAALETLSIIAYKQPITRVEIDEIRGVDSSGTVRNLLELGIIKTAGQKEALGRPILYQTTEQFLKVFGLRRLTDLPSLQDLRKQYKEQPQAEDNPETVEAPESSADEITETNETSDGDPPPTSD